MLLWKSSSSARSSCLSDKESSKRNTSMWESPTQASPEIQEWAEKIKWLPLTLFPPATEVVLQRNQTSVCDICCYAAAAHLDKRCRNNRASWSLVTGWRLFLHLRCDPTTCFYVSSENELIHSCCNLFYVLLNFTLYKTQNHTQNKSTYLTKLSTVLWTLHQSTAPATNLSHLQPNLTSPHAT